MNSNSTLRWLTSLCVTLLLLLAGQQATAQCDISFPPSPATIGLTLDPVTGTANLTRVMINNAGYSTGTCSPMTSAKTRIYADQAKTVYLGTPPLLLDCSDLASPQPLEFWVAFAQAAGDPPNDPNESEAKQFFVHLEDITPPNISCPASPAVFTDLNQCYATVGGLTPSYSDNCGVTKLTWIKSAPTAGVSPATGINDVSGTTFNTGTTTITYTASDLSGNTATCNFTVAVTDNQPPAIGPCPANASVSTDPGECSAFRSFTQPPSSDNCAVALVTWSAPGAIPPSGSGNMTNVEFPEGMTTVTYTATDGSGNPAAVPCNFSVTVNDTEAPVLVGTPSSPPPVGTSTGTATPGNLCDGSYTWNHPSITDNCAGPNLLTMQLSGATVAPAASVTQGASITQLFNLGTTVITYKATDVNGGTSTTSFSVTVFDNVPPVVVPAPVSQVFNYTVTAGDCSKVVTFTRPSQGSVSDCGSVTFTESVLSGPDPLVLSGAPAFPLGGGGSITVQFPAGITVIRYQWTDNVGNEVHIDYTFNIVENEAPDAKCTASTITLVLDPQIGVALLDPSVVDNGSTDNCGIASITVSPTLFDCTTLGANTVTLTVTDENSNSDNCTASVFVVDNTSPVVSCPGNLTVPANAMCQGSVGDLIFNQAAPIIPITVGPKEYFDNALDPCGITFQYKINAGSFTTVPVGMFSDYNLTGLVFNSGLNTVTIRVLDGSNNAGTCSFTVNVTDQVGPTFTPVAGPPASPANGSTVNLNTTANGCGQFYNWSWPTVADACSNPVSTVLQTHQPNAFFPLGNTTVTWLAKDNAGNIGTYTFIVNVKDMQPPVAKCKDATLNLDAMGAATLTTAQVDNGSTDNCFFTLALSKTNFTCADLGTQTVTLTATDGGVPVNTNSCTATITVNDLIPPTASCQAGTLQVNVTGASATITTSQIYASISDNCVAKDSIRLDAGAYAKTLTVGCPQIGAHVVTLKVTDNAGNTATCQRNIQVNDTGVPTFTAPGPVTIACNVPSLPVNTGGTPTASDNCDAAPVVTYTDVVNAGSCPNSFTITRTWKATDASNNTTTHTQVITVQDIVKPVFTMASTFTTTTDSPNFCDGPLTVTVTPADISDNCSDYADLTFTHTVDYPTPSYGYVDVPVPVAGNSVGAFFPIGTTTIVFIAKDECNNTSTHSVQVVVTDTQGPVFSYPKCGEHIVLPNTSGACSNLYSWVRPWSAVPNVSDCLSFSVSESISDPTVQQSINVSNPFSYNGFFFQVFATAQFPVGVTTVTYTAVDASLNVSTCAFTVEIEDIQAPLLTCPGNQTFTATCPTAQVPDYRNLVLVSDNCPGDVVLTQTYAPGTTLGSIFSPNPPVSGNTFQITIQGQDAYNTASCSFNVTLQDGQAPIPTIAVLPMLVDSCGGFVIEAPTANDPCNPNAPIIYGSPSTPVGTFIPGTPPKYNLTPGNYVITWVYNDGNGNISTQAQNITVLNDIFPPVALCKPPFSVNLNNLGLATISVAQIDNGSNDPNDCGPITFSLINSILDCTEIGQATVSLVVTDHMNNKDTCSTTVTVIDNTPPLLSQPAVIPPIEACSPIPPPATLSATDQCDDDVEIVLTQTSTQDTIGFGKYNYTITRLWIASDTSGNTSSALQVITVHDTQAPVFNVLAPDTLIIPTAPNALNCSAFVNLNIAPFVSDCATGVDLTISSTGGIGSGANVSGTYSVGTHIVVFTAKDATNNTSTHSVTVIVNDVTPPTAVCINGVSAALQPSGTVNVTVNQFNNNSFDNCTSAQNLLLAIQRLDDDTLQTPSATLEYDCSDADGTTQHPVKLFVTDQYGNMSNCQTYIVIQDNVNPTITFCPPSKTVLCSDDLSPSIQQEALATDNCPDNVSVNYSDSSEPDTIGNACYLIHRVWTAHDLAGNTSTCVQTFSVIDTVAPVLSAYNPDITISCSEVLPGPLAITATDNCSLNVPVLLEEDTLNVAQGPCGKYSYTIARTRTAVDDCGNATVSVRYITVVDTTAPSFPGLPDTIKVFSANNPPNNNCTVPVSLDVSQYLFDCSLIGEMLVLNDAPFGNDSLVASGNYPVGSYMIHFYATDACGNVGQDSVVLEVIDNSIPTAICNNNVVISLGSNGSATIQPDDIDLASTDNCSIDTMYLDHSSFDCGDLGQNPVTLTVVDVYGNLNTCTVNVNVTLGIGSGLSLSTQAIDESFYGAADGTASVTATGGSGNFTYEWSTDEFTSSITDLTEGTYYVTVYDQNSGCQQVDSVTINAGAKIKLTVGDADGAQGEIVTVPVSVDNFTSVDGFSFTINVLDPSVGTVLGVSSVDAALSANLQVNLLAGNNLGVLWTDINPLSLPDGTIMFYVDVQLSSVAPLGSLSPVNAVGVPVVLNFTVEGSGGPVDVPVDQMNGSVEITSLVNTDVTLAGDIKTWANPENPNSVEKPVANVTVTLSGAVSGTEVTTATGTYDFSVPLNVNTLTACNKVTVGPPFNAGVTAGDLLRIVNHIFGDTLPSPYQWVAADVNNSKTVTLADYLLIQRLALGTDQHIMNSPDWKFVPKSYTFPPNDTPFFGPLTVPFPQSIEHNPTDQDYLDDDFVAVRMGDVNGNTPVNFTNDDADDRSGDFFKFRLTDQGFKAGELVAIPFKASDFTNRRAYQMTINFDPTVFELADMKGGKLELTEDNFGTAHLSDGFLTTLWVSRDPLTLSDDEVLFTVTFRALRGSNALSKVLHVGSEVTRAEAYDLNGNTMKVDFEFVQPLNGLNETDFTLYQNQPNPFREGTSIGFRLPEAGRASLRVYNAAGQLVKLVVGNFDQGYNEVRFQQSDLGTPGVYWYELETPTHSDRKKMILID